MVDEFTKGNMQNGVFYTRIWNSIKDKLNFISNRSFSVKQIKQKFHRIRTKHRDLFTLATHVDLVGILEPTLSLLVHPEATQFQKKGCEHYKLLGILFNRSTATGVLHQSSTQDPPNTDEELELENQYLNNGVHVDVNQDSSNDDLQTIEQTTHRGKRKIQARERKSYKESKTFQMADALQAWAKASKTKAEVSFARAEKYRATSSYYSTDYSITKCVASLEEIEDIANNIYIKALKKFVEPTWSEMFLAMSTDRRKAMLDTID
ncbi:uncharacterized protein LOC133283570 [Gastrolobium bilobum]|uniref:uncharacterized protein LOC133283570 n=1 Tax=Gastrolobium bilobum TaxID=150636 RepID=UPI002AB0208C|nr:uncharacterized protein LOC133283570 [Gastrolobium bilobum]